MFKSNKLLKWTFSKDVTCQRHKRNTHPDMRWVVYLLLSEIAGILIRSQPAWQRAWQVAAPSATAQPVAWHALAS